MLPINFSEKGFRVFQLSENEYACGVAFDRYEVAQRFLADYLYHKGGKPDDFMVYDGSIDLRDL